MVWIHERKRIWHTAVLGLLLVAIAGPWTFDRIHVPAEYPCSLPNIRLQGDFCGLPLSGIRMIAWIISGLFSIVSRRATGAVAQAELLRGLLVFFFLLVLLLPFFTTLLLILRGYGRSKFHILIWVLAAGACLFLGLSDFAGLHPALWGLWLYLGLALGVLALELLAFAASRRDTLK